MTSGQARARPHRLKVEADADVSAGHCGCNPDSQADIECHADASSAAADKNCRPGSTAVATVVIETFPSRCCADSATAARPFPSNFPLIQSNPIQSNPIQSNGNGNGNGNDEDELDLSVCVSFYLSVFAVGLKHLTGNCTHNGGTFLI